MKRKVINRGVVSSFIFILICVLALSVGCSQLSGKEKSIETMSYSDLLKEDGSYGLPGVQFGSSMKNVEEAMKIQFPDIPYDCVERNDGTLPEHPELVKDYRNSTDYEYVSMTAYRNDLPVLYQYDGENAHIVFSFSQDELIEIMILFGQQSVRDPNMDFGGAAIDVDDVFLKIRDGLIEGVGEYSREVIQQYTTGEPSYYWDSTVDVGDGYETKMALIKLVNTEKPEYGGVKLTITRLKEVGRQWVMYEYE